MSHTELIPIKDFCEFHQVERTFIVHLEEMGVVQCVEQEKTVYITKNMLFKIERLMRIQHDFDMRIQDLDIIDVLLSRIDDLEQKLGHR